MDADISLEDGEIIDDTENIECDESYTPLQRPSTYSSTLTQPRFPTPQELDTEDEVESSTDSDSDTDVKRKHPKLSFKRVQPKSSSRKRYDIWNTHVQEDVLLENLVNCDVSTVDRSRSVESYPIPYLNKLPPANRKNNKRTRSDRNNSSLRLHKEAAPNTDNVTSASRIILDVNVTIHDTEDDIAKDIANKLYEEKEDLIRTIVVTAGKEKALQLFNETKRIEEEGGMLIMNQTRRRTPGGVYLFLVKHDSDLTREQQNEIFQEERLNYKKEVRAKRKQKLQQIKQKIAATKSVDQTDLLTRAELCVQLAEDQQRERRKSDDVDVKNPPPSPVTDGHDNSTDGMENLKEVDVCADQRTIINYGDDCLDVAVDMDLF